MTEHQWIEGVISVESVLRANSRDVSEIMIRQDRYEGALARIQTMAQAKGIALSRVPAASMAELIPGGESATVIAAVGLKRMVALAELGVTERPVIALLDGVEDPFNFGQAVRSLYAAGIDGLIVRPRNWLSEATVIRASAGATEFMSMAVAEVDDAIKIARERGLSIIVAMSEGARLMYEVDLSGPLLLIIGGEKRGVARSVLQAADNRVRIPYGRDFPYSLGTAGATAILAFEIMRQRLMTRA
ncbi:MAG: RNA methyltransferase [Anaerolineae bacterium]|nr:RNA methyltransferase [Anaerolineae bacterium]RIK22772.1 MAG: hypothetical protein DCC51_04500 [Anaerolineae bacterium]